MVIFGHETWPLAKLQKLYINSLSTPRGRNWAYFYSTGSIFWDMRSFSKLPYLGMKLGHWQNFQKCTYTLFYPMGVKIELIFTLRVAVSEICADSENCHIWAWNLAIVQNSRSCTYTLILPHGVEIELVFALRVSLWDTGRFPKLPWAWNLITDKSSRRCTYTHPKLFLGPKFHSVLLYSCPFPRYWHFFFYFPIITVLNFNLFF